MSNACDDKLLPQMKDAHGKFALKRGGDLVAIYDWFDEALQAAHTLCEGEQFSIEKIDASPRRFRAA